MKSEESMVQRFTLHPQREYNKERKIEMIYAVRYDENCCQYGLSV